MSFDSYLHRNYDAKEGQIVPLIDPEKWDFDRLEELCHQIKTFQIPYVLFGGSTLNHFRTPKLIAFIQKYAGCKVILFPGNGYQVDPSADGILLLSLMSGRNPEYLISKQFEAAPLIRKSGMECIPTGYLLIGDQATSSTSYVTQTLPIPPNKPNLIIQTAITSELLGMKAIYLEAGSGSNKSIDPELFIELREHIRIPIIVGGGIRSHSQVQAYRENGAAAIILGNALEENMHLLAELSTPQQRQ